jgi:sec-independent protein translocase protein TatA
MVGQTGWLSPWHWIIIGLVALLFFGNRLPEVARSLGRAFKEFKRGLRDVSDDISREPPEDRPAGKPEPPSTPREPRRPDPPDSGTTPDTGDESSAERTGRSQ